jgi:hypothetical protein
MRRMTAVLRPLLGAACASAALLAVAAAQTPTAAHDTFPAVALPGTQLRQLTSAATGRSYDIYVSTPPDYARSPAARYPVLYVLDGQWDFKLLLSIQGGLFYDRFTPPIIIVGITYSGANANYDSLRATDLTPVTARQFPGSGAGPRFLSFVRDQLIPFIESNYRADRTRRVLMGSSFGGLFTLYAMLSDPTLFWGYVAASPAVSYASRAVFDQEAAYAAEHQELRARLFISVGSLEALAAPVQDLMGVVQRRSYTGLTLQTRVIEGERHSGNKPEAFNRGLRFIFGN